jgi:hypothetical protein
MLSDWTTVYEALEMDKQYTKRCYGGLKSRLCEGEFPSLANSMSSGREMLSRDWSLSSLLHTFPASRQFIRYLDWLLIGNMFIYADVHTHSCYHVIPTILM